MCFIHRKKPIGSKSYTLDARTEKGAILEARFSSFFAKIWKKFFFSDFWDLLFTFG